MHTTLCPCKKTFSMPENTIPNWHHPTPLLPVSPSTLCNGFIPAKDQLGFLGEKMEKGLGAFSNSNPLVQLSSARMSVLSKSLPQEKRLQNGLDRIALQNIKD